MKLYVIIGRNNVKMISASVAAVAVDEASSARHVNKCLFGERAIILLQNDWGLINVKRSGVRRVS